MEKTKLLNQLEQIAAKVSVDYVPELSGLIAELKPKYIQNIKVLLTNHYYNAQKPH